ncbi:MAG: calcium/proton exchanger [Clostridiaceae bacterium]
MKILKLLLVFVPISFIVEFLHFSPVFVFTAACLSIVPLAGIMGEATEELTYYAGPRLGGFLNGTFGNATELIISVFALKAGLFDVVKASIAGSVLGNILLVLGASMLAGGLKYKIQTFNKNAIGASTSMLFLAVIALSIPAMFTNSIDANLVSTRYESFSVGIAVLLNLIYILGLVFSFYTHKDLYGTEHPEVAEETKWSLKKSIIILIIATILIAIESEFLVSSVEPMTKALNLSEFFVGIILIPLIGNAAEHSTAVIFAIKNRIEVAVEIAVGSSLQIILFVAPVLIFVSLFFKSMSIIFNVFELVSLISSVLIVSKISNDGESNWFEGVQLITVYIIIAMGFFILK